MSEIITVTFSFTFIFICIRASLGYLLHDWVLYHFLGQGKAPVLSSLIKLQCAGTHQDSYVEKKPTHQHFSTYTGDVDALKLH